MLKERFQRRALRKGASPVPTGLVPLSRIRSAVVLTDSPAICADAFRSFFRRHGIKLTVVDVTGILATLNWYGKPRDARPLEADLFISLIPARLYAVDYMAACSPAVFKVGRYDAPVFDLVFRDPPENPVSPVEAFRALVKLLEKIV
ncbi:MAG: hypothetical protein J5745_00450 [Bacteroidales bacterium]|nr:hypothetical protein [Bacteroidales bacterium]